MSNHVSLEKYTQEIEKLSKQIGELQKDLESEKKYHFVLSIRSRIEFLQNILSKDLKDRIPRHANREEIWLIIMDQSRHPLIHDLKDRINENPGMTVEIFCEAVHTLYGDFSDRVAHSVDIPHEITSTDIISLLELLQAPRDEPYQKTVEILISNLKLKTVLNKSDSSGDSIGFETN